ncbi:hypothetical protein [Aliikangiella coralliicola]|uniref:Uncharacterized protein n=1 Tax=Aliikangiella coralliicola TaxID=2592383 RepID=A0A545UDP2_9GAMM|nr:hypothetical protein [Aliikangiella coralliicola]TQV87563.1 hypothetical protein FLL46_11875 [Aliikangiella coralliicola]
MSKLEKIAIKNIKGISNKSFDLQLFPNKPSILVAPNGFGKSSLACAFNSMNNARIDLAECNHFNKDKAKKPEIVIQFDGTQFKATENSNTILKNLGVSVINSHVVPDAKKRRIGGFTAVTTSLKVSPVVLIDNIPDKVDFSYKYSDLKTEFGPSGKALPNASKLLSELAFVSLIEREINFSDFKKKLKYKNPITRVVEEINTFEGTAVQIQARIESDLLDQLRAVDALKSLADLIREYNDTSEVEAYLLAWQIAELSRNPDFKLAIEYRVYLNEKLFFDELLSAADTTRHKIKTKEEKKKQKKRLVVNFPDADDMSNGQRDILSFIAQIQRSLKKLKKQNCILVIDEIFDYLDDANLVAFQYYVTQIIERFKKQERNIFPLLLTHLDPGCFKHFCFNKHKLQIRYLNRDSELNEPVFLKIVKNRKDQAIENELSKYHFHYHPHEVDLEDDFQRLNMRKAWGKSHSFYSAVNQELRKYLESREFDPIAILFAVRIKIEEIAYGKLANQEQQTAFLEEHGTSKKLDYCHGIGMDVPESHYLLGLIYNDNLHWNNKRDYSTPLIAKLENFTIRKMIAEVFS